MSKVTSPGIQVEPVAALGPDALSACKELLASAEAADGWASISDAALLLLDRRAGAGTWSGFFVLAWALPQHALAGCAVVQGDATAWTAEVGVHPDDRDAAVDVRAALVRAVRHEVARRGGGVLRLWGRGAAPGDTSGPDGFTSLRDLLQLRVPLPLPVPAPVPAPTSSPSVEVRPFRPGADEDAWLSVNNRAFAGHPEQSGWRRADLERREAEPWFDPAGFLLHEIDGRLAAFCWTKEHVLEGLGEIYVIGVDPDFQGRGLGRALTVAGLGHLARRGLRTGMLYVEQDNAAALRLYSSIGFVLHHIDREYQTSVPAAPPAAAPAT